MYTDILRPINVSGMKFSSEVMNGAGPVKFPEDVLQVAKSSSAAVVLGSITVEERSGNSGRTYYPDYGRMRFSLNSRGLPNPGIKYYERFLPEMAQMARDNGKPLIVSVAGFSPDEYAVLTEAAFDNNADGGELNLGCPNVWSKEGVQKRIASFYEDIVGETLRKVEKSVGVSEWVSVKLSPFSDPTRLESVAQEISRSKLVKAVTTCNAFPNAFGFNEEEPAIDAAGGLAGMGGEALKPIGLGQVKQLKSILPGEIGIIGVGGVRNRGDVEDYLRIGAVVVQATTAFINAGTVIFEELNNQEG